MNPNVPAATVTTTSSYAWEGYLFLGLIVIAIIILIIFLIYVNRGNTLNAIQSLPNYLIQFPKGNTFLGLKNIPSPDINVGGDTPIGTPFWKSYAWVTPDKTYPLGLWKINVISQTPDGMSKQVQVINAVYNTQSINQPPTGLGFLKFFQTDFTNLASSSNNMDQGDIFTYTQIAVNTFTLQIVLNNISRNVIVDDFNFLNVTRQTPPEAQSAIFKLVTINNV